MPPDILVVGHIVKDLTPAGWRPGGGVFYGSAQAQRLGLRVAAVTACGADIEPASLLPGVEWRVRRDAQTTTFENVYEEGRRRQRLLALARRISLRDIPEGWRAAPIILLTPVFHDVDPRLPGRLAEGGGLLGIGAQGWLRRRAGDKVLPGRIDAGAAWLAGGAIFLSEEDADDAEAAAAWKERVDIVVLTRAARGCTLWVQGQRYDVRAFPAAEVDATGAGDVFAAAFLVVYAATRDALGAARFAAAAAALCVRAPGIGALGGRREIEALMAAPAAVGA